MTKAYIEEQIDEYTYKVRMVFYNKSDSSAYKTLKEYLYEATVCTAPGVIPTYDVGDVVFVEFEDDQISKPVIVGRLLREKQQSYSDLNINSLNVSNETNLSEDTTIGDVAPKKIKTLKGDGGAIDNQFSVIAEQVSGFDDDIASIKQDIIDLEIATKQLSHVGMIIYSTTLDTEAKVKAQYGGTTWVQITDKFLIGASSNYAINSTGGEATHTLTTSEMPSHTHDWRTYTYGSNNYNFLCANDSGSGSWVGDNQWKVAARRSVGGTSYDHTAAVSNIEGGNPILNSGSGNAHNNLPPYRAVYIWERTV